MIEITVHEKAGNYIRSMSAMAISQVWRRFDTYQSEMVCGSAYDSKYPQFGHRNVLTGMA